jgi:hypothetical protein
MEKAGKVEGGHCVCELIAELIYWKLTRVMISMNRQKAKKIQKSMFAVVVLFRGRCCLRCDQAGRLGAVYSKATMRYATIRSTNELIDREL